MPLDFSASDLPIPDETALQHSQKLYQFILAKLIQRETPQMSFAEFMQDALYAPGLGYYSAGLYKLGAAGDFMTAPEISTLFAKTLAQQCVPLLKKLPNIFEFGAGSGIMAANILLHLEALACLPQHYFILEVSADLQQRQKLTLQELCPHLLSRVEWLAALPHEPIAAIVFANEVLDAMPVERFRVSAAGLEQWMIIAKEGQLVSCYQPSDHVLTEFTTASLPLGYEFEINFQAQAWINSLYACFSSVVILLIDYGYGESEYFDPGRVGGTLACYYRHRQHDDPLQLIGLQDISAQINFTSLAQAAVAVGFDVLGFTNQAAFLLANGILTLLDQTSDAIAFNQQQQIKQLLLPTQMGEQFKVLALGKNFTEPLQGFSLLDLLWKL